MFKLHKVNLKTDSFAICEAQRGFVIVWFEWTSQSVSALKTHVLVYHLWWMISDQPFYFSKCLR